MKITFGEVSQEKTLYSKSVHGLDTSSEFSFSGHPTSQFTLQRKHDQSIVMTGVVCVGVTLNCDRCGEIFNHTLETDYYYIFKEGEDDTLRMPEIECSDVDCHTVYLKEPVIDVTKVLREQIFLSVPDRRVCDDGCKGICPLCGANRNHEICQCSKENLDSPFSVLKNLKKH